jgi:hypothetical protein
MAMYIGEKWPMLAMAMCLFASPVHEFHPELLRHAVASIEAGPLRSWMAHCRRHFETFAQVFCHAPLDSLDKPVPLDEGGREALCLLARGDAESLEQFYHKVVERLCAEG